MLHIFKFFRMLLPTSIFSRPSQEEDDDAANKKTWHRIRSRGKRATAAAQQHKMPVISEVGSLDVE